MGGIAGQMYCNGGGFILSGCINEADFDEGQAAAGIAYQISQMKGEAIVENCVNNGRIASDGQYAGGIITYIPNLGDEWHITVDGCKNTADISSAQHVGGIVCFNFYDHQEGTSDTSMTITNCENSGSLLSSSTNAYIGGILAVDGLKTTPVQISHCTNTGSISFTEPMVIDQETLDSKELFAFSVTAGGIVGRIGESLFLTTDADSVDASAINGDEALVTIEDCHSSGSIQCEDIQFEAEPEEGREEWMERYWQENLGGILGTSSCTDGFTVRVTDCTYKGVSRGMGSEELPDVGTKED